MNFAERLKTMRKEKKITQAGLAADLGISKATVAMWESGRREPNFETLNKLSDYFDRRVDYILGQTENAVSVAPTEAQAEQLGAWAVEDDFAETVIAYLRLDEYGKRAVEDLIRNEIVRCRSQGGLLPKGGFEFTLRVRKEV
jgi:transcriptional regulator with XRE-family HTH domain